MRIEGQRGKRSAVVIGAGIVGLFTAWRLCEAGFLVTVLERGALGRQSSWAGGGILSPLYPWRGDPAIWSMASASIEAYPQICAQLANRTGIDPEWTPCGMAVLEPGDSTQALAWAQTVSRPVEISTISGTGQAALQGLWLPWVAHVRNPRLCQALAARLRQLGVEIEEACGELVVGIKGRRAHVLGRPQVPDCLVVCAGAWSQPLTAPLAWPVPVRPVFGQMLLFHAEPGCLQHIILRDGRYLIPRRDGRILVGSTVEDVGYQQPLTAEAQQQLRAFAESLLPSLSSLPIERHWGGLRPGTADGVPVVAKHPDLENLYINAGHYRNGITLAPQSAMNLVDLIHRT